eukprot:353710-Chlamydomonas_euryale.AAC.2
MTEASTHLLTPPPPLPPTTSAARNPRQPCTAIWSQRDGECRQGAGEGHGGVEQDWGASDLLAFVLLRPA